MSGSLGGGFGAALAPVTFLLTGLVLTDEQFMNFGWRIPFLASVILIAVGLYIRLTMEETPVFAAVKTSGLSKVPLFEAFKRQPKEIILASGAVNLSPTFGYLGAAYLIHYGATTLDLARSQVLLLSAFSALALCAGVVFGGAYSDRVGRRRVLIGAGSCGVVWALVLFPILDIGASWTFAVGMGITMLIAGVALGPVSAMMSELFQTRYRYTAAGLSYNITQIIAGGIMPLLAAWIVASFGGFAFGLALAALALTSVLSAVTLKETKDLEMNRA
jgi:MFS family permease